MLPGFFIHDYNSSVFKTGVDEMNENYKVEEFLDFFYKSFGNLFPGKKLEHANYINIIADRLMACLNGKINRLIINMPPRHMKSSIVSVAFPAFVLGKDPTKTIIVASYSNSLSTKHSLDTRFIILSDFYKIKFPNTKLNKNQNTKNKFQTTQMGFRAATSISGTLTGEGGDILIADDPISAGQVSSEQFRQKVQDWFHHTFMTRLNNRNNSIAIIVMHRLHEDDICGYLTKNGNNWEILSLPCVSEIDKEISLLNSKKITYQIEKGSILNNNYLTDDNVKEIKKEVGSYIFSSQYQQNPISSKNSIIKREWVKRYEIFNNSQSIENNGKITQSWDTAISDNDNNDYSVCATFIKFNNNFYLIDVYRNKLLYPDLKKQIILQAQKWKPDNILIENKSSGQILIQDLKKSTILPIIGINVSISKLDRLYKVISFIESGRLFLPLSSDWLTDFEYEFFSFPNSKNDDQVDCVSQYLNYELKKNYNEINILSF
jgi:predicted phage terminase large subunit-like protein